MDKNDWALAIAIASLVITVFFGTISVIITLVH